MLVFHFPFDFISLCALGTRNVFFSSSFPFLFHFHFYCHCQVLGVPGKCINLNDKQNTQAHRYNGYSYDIQLFRHVHSLNSVQCWLCYIYVFSLRGNFHFIFVPLNECVCVCVLCCNLGLMIILFLSCKRLPPDILTGNVGKSWKLRWHDNI